MCTEVCEIQCKKCESHKSTTGKALRNLKWKRDHPHRRGTRKTSWQHQPLRRGWMGRWLKVSQLHIQRLWKGETSSMCREQLLLGWLLKQRIFVFYSQHKKAVAFTNLHLGFAIIGMLQAGLSVMVWCPFLLCETLKEIWKTGKIIRQPHTTHSCFQMLLTYSKCHFQLMFSTQRNWHSPWSKWPMKFL